MYKTLRNIHLLCGLFSCFFLLMYGVSAVQMSHHDWFDIRPAVTERRIALAPGQQDGRAVALALMREHGLRGTLNQIRPSAAGLAFGIVRPGMQYQVQYEIATGAATVKESRSGFLGMLNRIHHAGGLTHDYWLINLWGGMIGLVSLALLAVGVTGVWMWFKLHSERLAGAVLLGLCLAASVPLIVLIRMG